MVYAALAAGTLLGAARSLGRLTAPLVVAIEGAARFEIPHDWLLFHEGEQLSIASRIASVAISGAWKVDLGVGRRLVFFPKAKKAGAIGSIAMGDSNALSFSQSDLPTSASGTLNAAVLLQYQVVSDAFERAISRSGGQTLSRMKPHPVNIGTSIGVESGVIYRQVQGTTVARQIVAFAGDRVLMLTFSYPKRSEPQFAPLYERVRSSLKLA